MEVTMLRTITAGVTALLITASAPAYAQAPAARGPDQGMPDLSKLNDARIEIVKFALQLTPEQMKYWPAIEAAIQSRAQSRQARIATTAETVGERRDAAAIDTLRNRDPVEFLDRRAGALAQRSTELKQLADAWKPLYVTLTPDQKRRMGVLTVLMVRQARDLIESDDDE
jgi:hypothetical protein